MLRNTSMEAFDVRSIAPNEWKRRGITSETVRTRPDERQLLTAVSPRWRNGRPPSEFSARLDAIRGRLADTDADAAVWFGATSIEYLTGFDGRTRD
ncbi:hypothetical protein C8039_05645 [Halogeometricum sp. wsp3]|nr:hypothetical protein C8039_05645 [Halogeometricum sp. wsp3]